MNAEQLGGNDTLSDDTKDLIYLRWDYYGPLASGTAEHFERHLRQFLETHALNNVVSGVNPFVDPRGDLVSTQRGWSDFVRERLRPHRWDRRFNEIGGG